MSSDTDSIPTNIQEIQNSFQKFKSGSNDISDIDSYKGYFKNNYTKMLIFLVVLYIFCVVCTAVFIHPKFYKVDGKTSAQYFILSSFVLLLGIIGLYFLMVFVLRKMFKKE